MKKYIIAIGLFCLSLFFIDNAYALTTDLDITSIDSSNYVLAWDCTSSSSCGVDISLSSSGTYPNFVTTSGTVNIGSLGVFFAYNSDIKFVKDYLYSLSTLVCYTKAPGSTGATTTTAVNAAKTKFMNMNYSSTTTTTLSGNVLWQENQVGQFNKCQIYQSVLSPSETGSWVGIHLKNTTTISGVKVSLVGFKAEALGVYSESLKDDISSIVKNSGLATATSVEEVQQAQEEIKTELQNTQSAIDEQTQQQQEQHKETMDTITNSDSSEATGDASGFFEGFNTDTFGLTSIITSPLNLIQNITSKTCTPLNLQIPFVDKTMQLPCMSTIYQRHFGSFLSVYQTITFGIISYWVCIRVFALVKDFKNPDHDEIEVMDL